MNEMGVHDMRRDWLKNARKRRGYTQSQVASHLGVALRSVQKWEGGERTPSRAAQFLLANLLGRKLLKQFDAEIMEVAS